MIGSFSNIMIQGMSAAVPSYIEENMEFANIMEARRVKKQIRVTGVERRHVSGKHQRTSDLCYAAVIPLLKKLQWKRDEVKVLIFITQGPNYAHPSTAFFLHKRLGLSKDCLAYDMNLGCSSFNVGIHTVSALLQTCEEGAKALLLIGDTAGMVRNPEDSLKPDEIAHDMLFGSAGAAIALEKLEDNPLYFMNKSDGNRYDAIIGHWGRPSHLDGAAVFSFAINDVSDSVMEFRDVFGFTEDKIDYYVFHQAQDLILDNIIDACHIPEEKELRSLREYGNTSGTSIPVTVCANRDKLQNEKKAKVLFCGFGVGLSWGTIYAEINTENILPIIETNEHFDEDKKPANGLHDRNLLVLGADTTLGEWLARYDNDKSARVIMAGKNIGYLQKISEDLFLDSELIEMEKINEQEIDKVLQFCNRDDELLDGVVIPVPISRDLLLYISRQLVEKYGKEDVSIVVLAGAEKEDDIESLKQSMERLIENTSCRTEEKMVRVNGIVYAEEQMEFIQIENDGVDWIRLYFENKCPKSMKNPIHISKAQKFLLSDDSKYITETVLSLNVSESV